MINRYALFFLVVSTTLLSGCYTTTARQEFGKRIRTCYTGGIIESLNNKFDNKGYYTCYEKLNNSGEGLTSIKGNIPLDSFQVNIMFFDDGIYLNNFYIKDKYADDIQYYFNNVFGTDEDIDNYWYNPFMGSYTLSGDTIKTQFFFIGSLNAGWYGVEEWFKIIDRTKLKSIYRGLLGIQVTNELLQAYSKNHGYYPLAKFVPLNRMPSSDCWLKKEKWFWCNEYEWRNYMETNGFKMKRKDRMKK